MKKIICLVAGFLTVIGAINWGLVAFDMNLVQQLFGTMPQVVKAIYILIGISGLVTAVSLVQGHHD